MRKYSYICESGNFIFELRDNKLYEIQLPISVEQQDFPHVSLCKNKYREILKINIEALELFLDGRFKLIEIEEVMETWEMNFTIFYEEIYQKVIEIEPGTTLSYKDIAELSGNPNSSRAIGSAMRKNRFPLLIPCHRVIKSDGNIGEYSGANGTASKQKLINWEINSAQTLSRFIF